MYKSLFPGNVHSLASVIQCINLCCTTMKSKSILQTYFVPVLCGGPAMQQWASQAEGLSLWRLQSNRNKWIKILHATLRLCRLFHKGYTIHRRLQVCRSGCLVATLPFWCWNKARPHVIKCSWLHSSRTMFTKQWLDLRAADSQPPPLLPARQWELEWENEVEC